jgi:VRR-NUC domain
LKDLFGKTSRKAPVKEMDILRSATDWLDVNQYLWWRMPLGPVLHSKGGQVRYKKNPLKGFPDIAGILKHKIGMFFACEFKSKNGSESEVQIEWRNKLQNAGAKVFVCRSLDEFINNMKEIDNG